MIRATVHFRKEGEATHGWVIDFAALPRIGEEIRLLDGEGADEAYGTVAALVHTLTSWAAYQAGAQMVEVYVDAA